MMKIDPINTPETFLAFISLLSVFVLSACKEKPPLVVAIDPKIGSMGDIVSIAGENFGGEQGTSYVTIAGQEPTSSSYLEWSNTLIRVRLPEFGGAGLIYVHRGGRKSNPVLFSDRGNIPQSSQTAHRVGPVIDEIRPSSAPIGSLISIRGNGFGTNAENGKVFFTWSAENSTQITMEAMNSGLGDEKWTSEEIRVHIPDGAISGNIEVHTSRGKSLPVYFEVTGKPGFKTFKDKRSYTVSYSVNIKVQAASAPNTLYVWVPEPTRSASQPNIQLLSRNNNPIAENYRGTSLFQLKDVVSGANININLSYVVDAYGVETNINLSDVSSQNSMPDTFLQETPLLPVDKIQRLAETIVGRERNPYVKAKRIYDWILDAVAVQAEPLYNEVENVVEQKKADAYSASLLFCTLARGAGIPALPIAGVLVDRFRETSPHYWAEFWIEGLGWVPVDMGLGAGLAPKDFSVPQDARAWYFGNIDSQRIAFSRGQNPLSPMDPRGRRAIRNPDYALQDFWEEAVGDIQSYSSLWSGIAVTGAYAQ
ncbi:MAG: IPT/TIG domain-containing protein [Treponema sp.]|jgi:transglutaminase-like putative cysteine protease|nr:IPT/TIG domain-containing protein [Treponema sp.]